MSEVQNIKGTFIDIRDPSLQCSCNSVGLHVNPFSAFKNVIQIKYRLLRPFQVKFISLEWNFAARLFIDSLSIGFCSSHVIIAAIKLCSSSLQLQNKTTSAMENYNGCLHCRELTNLSLIDVRIWEDSELSSVHFCKSHANFNYFVKVDTMIQYINLYPQLRLELLELSHFNNYFYLRYFHTAFSRQLELERQLCCYANRRQQPNDSIDISRKRDMISWHILLSAKYQTRIHLQCM